MKLRLPLAGLASLLLATAPTLLGAVVKPLNDTPLRVRSVFTAFDNLKHHGDPIAFNHDGGPVKYNGIPTDSHYQGIARTSGAGVPYLFVSGSVKSGDKKGVLLSVRMGSRGTDGERLRSNRLAKDQDMGDTAPPSTDKVAAYREFNWDHPGGMQLCGDILAVPLEGANFDTTVEGRISFFDVSDPESPVELATSITSTAHKMGVAGLTKLPDGHFLVVATWGDNKTVEFYRSSHTNILDPALKWNLHDTWKSDELLGVQDWPTGNTSHQMLNFVLQSDGRLFMLGARNTSAATPVITGKDELYLYEVRGSEAGSSGIQIVQVKQARHLFCKNQETGFANFLAGIGAYVSPTGELIVYATEHYNKGPGSSVRLMEFRNRDIFPNDSPAYLPAAAIASTDYYVEEGSEILLDGSASRPSLARPWIELYDDDNFEGESLVLEYDDRHKDDYQDLRKMSFNDRASSLRYWMPTGWKIQLFDDDNFKTDGGVLTLNGAWGVQSIANLSDSPWKFDNGDLININETRVTSVAMIAPSAEAAAGNPAVNHQWDIVSSGTAAAKMEETGAKPRFLAVDGPGDVVVRLRVSGDSSTDARTTVHVWNATPKFRRISARQPLPLMGRVDLRIQFTDPGTEDRHTIRINWGDNTTTTHELPLRARSLDTLHVYPEGPDPARLFSGSIEISDDDGATVTTPLQFRPWTPMTALLDSDQDGIPDAWELENMGSLAASPIADDDGDGVPLVAEFAAGSDPTVPDARPLRFVREGSRLRLEFKAERGNIDFLGGRKRYYTISRSADFKTWQPVSGATQVTAQDQDVSVQVRMDGGAGFYRLDAEVQ